MPSKTARPTRAFPWPHAGALSSAPTRFLSRAGAGAGATALLALAALAGCGSSGSGSADPASVVPASAPLYASVAIKPAGGSGGAATVAAKKLTHLTEPYGSLAQTLLSSPGAGLEYKRDIGPWVGERAGVFVTAANAGKLTGSVGSLQTLLQGGLSSLSSVLGASALAEKGTQGAIVLQTTDAGAARSFVAKQAGRQGAHAASYRGVSFQITSGGVAEGIVKSFAVFGSESAVHAVIDTSLGAASFASKPGYSKPASATIASAYVEAEKLVGATQSSAGASAGGGGGTSGGSASAGGGAGQAVSLLGQLLGGVQSATLTATATSNSISLQGEVHSAGAAKPLFGAEGAQALGELPATSWLAAGVGDTGANLPRALALLQGVASLGSSTVFSSFGGPSIEKIFKALDAPGAKLQQDFGSWAGPGGMFVSGSGLFNLQAGLVIASSEPAASRAAVGKLAALMRGAGATVANASIPGADAAMSVKLPGFPAVIFIADGTGSSGQAKFVLGLGQQSIEGALSPSATLSTSAAYSNATATLGGGIEPSLIVEFPTLLGFLEGVGLTQSPSVSGLVPYLKSLGTLTAGATGSAGTQRYKVVLGLA
ncbi:MAG TPA: DUF3352 domain-containing protein [Solirubrobacteraceae bacterium]|nr:DUF3352 domain-containing protein [Solirubrobacteraceae bacterium]